MFHPQDAPALISQLVALNGEEGVCPTRADWAAILAFETGPVELMNLLKFRPEVPSVDGPISGAAAYAKYSAANAGPFARVGGERVFFGRVGYMFAYGDMKDWDAVIVMRYPSARALAAMWLDPDFVAAHSNRQDGVERSQVLIFRQ